MATHLSWHTPKLINLYSNSNSQPIPSIKEKEEQEEGDFNPLHRARITTNSSNTHSYNSRAIVPGRNNLSITGQQQMPAMYRVNSMHSSSHRCRTIIIRGKEGVDRIGNNINRHMTTHRMPIWELLEVPPTIAMEDNNKGGKVEIPATISMGRIIRGPTKMR
jgi:hypothetical protein